MSEREYLIAKGLPSSLRTLKYEFQAPNAYTAARFTAHDAGKRAATWNGVKRNRLNTLEGWLGQAKDRNKGVRAVVRRAVPQYVDDVNRDTRLVERQLKRGKAARAESRAQLRAIEQRGKIGYGRTGDLP